MHLKNIKRIAIFMSLFVVSGFAFATGEGFYMGVQVGYANLNNVPRDINTGQLKFSSDHDAQCDPNNIATCLIAPNVKPTNTGIATRVFMGANVGKYFGFEFGAAAYTPSEYEPDVDGFTHQPHIWEYSGDILGKIMYPLGPFSIFAKGGLGIVYYSPSNAILTSTGEEDSGGNVFFSPAYGFGVSYDITPNWVVDLSFYRIQGSDELEDIDFAGIGISYHFVNEYCGQFLC
jgi:opacity protein-like surface antigen